MPPSSPAVLVTGASSGIGAATAALLAARGFRVWGTSRRPPADAGPIRWVAMDVCDEAAARAGVARVADEAGGTLDGLVCNAGMGIFGSVEEVSLVRAHAQFETNVFGTLAPLRAALPGMRRRGAGRIVVVGSLAGRAPIPFQAHYSATKAALDAFVLALRVELAPTGVSVSLVEPGDIRTAFNDATDWGEPSVAYAERQRACEAVIRASLEAAPGPEVVAAAVLRALTARRPRVRYPVGPASRLVPLVRRLLPDALALRILRAHFRV
ncbi:MAG: SDR family NAD(P)-dependent oxidoreductase [bacterium]|nr:SDR family NAD(P)-dependent oxidoreductase [bacterium]